jgi:Ca2+-binding EF-hand superfamily protein
LHDYDADGNWEEQEILRTYGLMDESNQHVSPERKTEIAKELIKMLDANGDGLVSHHEFRQYVDDGKTLPDMGTGPGHHGDDEYEYEIHHWEKSVLFCPARDLRGLHSTAFC